MLSSQQRAELATLGHTRIRGVVDADVAGAMADRVWALLARRGIDRADRATWPVGFQSKLQGLRQSRTFDGFGTPAVAEVVHGLLGTTGATSGQPWGPALVTFPESGPWTLPSRIWHLDLPGRGDPDQPSVARLFGYVTDVAPQGGGTLVVEGSHELVRRMVAASPHRDAGSSSDIRRRLVARHPWFKALHDEDAGDRIERFMVDGDEVDGVRVRVAELTADAGDVVVMLPWTMHNLSMNVAARPRFMVTHSVYAGDAARV